MSEKADLWIAALVMLALSGALGGAVWFLAKRLSRRRLAALGVSLTTAILCLGFFLSDSPWIARALPFEAVIVFGNLVPPLVAMLAAVILRARVALWRRMVSSVALGLMGTYSLLAPLLADPPASADRWKDGVCLQTKQATCAAAAAATLLAHHGIRATEAEMARLCLTGGNGTRFHGLCRGLRRKTKGTSLRVAVRGGDVDDLLSGVELPAVVHVRLTPEVARREPRYSAQWGWIVGVTHTVVVFAIRDEGTVEVGDPAFGRERWGARSLRDLDAGRFVTLVQRTE